MYPKDLEQSAEDLLAACRAEGLRIVLAESCTGGLVAGCLTAIAGSSDVVDRGFVTYSNQAKQEELGVPEPLLAQFGAVSEEVVSAMAEGALQRSDAHLCAAVTGIAGPTGGTEDKPVGLVHIAAARKGGSTVHEKHVFQGDRTAVRTAAVAAALDLLRRLVD